MRVVAILALQCGTMSTTGATVHPINVAQLDRHWWKAERADDAHEIDLPLLASGENMMLMPVVQRAVTKEHPFADDGVEMTMIVT